MRNQLIELRKLMDRDGIDAYIIPSSDPHQSEYVADYYQGRKWLSGFTGSAGTVVVLKEKAGLWTDGRYYIQGEVQLKDSGIDLFKAGMKGVPTIDEWLASELGKDATLAFDGRVISEGSFKKYREKLDPKKVNYSLSKDLLEEIWKDRPTLSKDKIWDYSIEYAGEGRKEKIAKIIAELEKNDAYAYVVSGLDDIAWLLNLRGSDISFTPLFYSYVVVTKDGTKAFIDSEKLEKELVENLLKDGVEVEEYSGFTSYLEENIKGKKTICDPKKTSSLTYDILKSGEVVDIDEDTTTVLKAMKNDIEIGHLKNAYRKDSVALAKFFSYIEENIDSGITEYSSEKVLEGFRREDSSFLYNSFAPIAGHKDHGAMMHFKATPENTYTLEKKGFFLMDSGGQYIDGTTDITRTLVLGDLTHEEKRDFTLALQGVIDLSTTKFLRGTTGYALDIICRRPMWNNLLDYKCGTGHGVGFLLNIHEGPCGFGPKKGYDSVLDPGMVVTIEPGVYKQGRHGIRHENTIVIREYANAEFGEFLEMEDLTFFPIDTRGIITDMLLPAQRQWLNNYHKEVYKLLSPSLDGKALLWLEERTREI